MKVKNVYAALVAAPLILEFSVGFIPRCLFKPVLIRSSSPKQLLRSTTLNMAFQLENGQKSNMFDGPRNLVEERDACGVGFIFNRKDGGKKICRFHAAVS
jgi:hypothetical protein